MRAAQTNLQLLIEMKEAAYSGEGIRLVGEAYNVAARAYVDKFRATGKPLISHAVGTASLLLQAGRGPETVAAGILHAAPPDGDFGLRRWRSVIVDHVGTDVADLVDAYCALPWTYKIDQIKDLSARLDEFADIEREALIIRLANEVEDYIDDAAAHYGFTGEPTRYKSAAFRRRYILDTAPSMAAWAIKLDVPFLADSLEDVRASLLAEPEIQAWPRLSKDSTSMFFAPPESYRLRPSARVIRPLRRIQKKGARGSAAAVLRRFRGALSRQ